MLELFTTTQKAEEMLDNPIIEIIFMALFGLFIITVLTHIIIFFRIRATRNYVKQTKRMDIEPLQSIKTTFETRQAEETIKLDTFIQEKFSNWRILQIPVVNLIKLVQMTISIFILLGVLGTFIGLTISLGSISATSDQLIENISAVLSGIDVAFYTSIVGMSFSLVMTVLVRALNTEYLLNDLMLIVESQLESHEQHGMHRMISVSEMIHDSIQSLEKTNEKSLGSIVEAFAGFKDYTEGLQQSAEDLAAFNDGLSENLQDFHELFQQMSTVTDGFKDGTSRLNKNFSSLFSYFESIDRKNERMVKSFEQTNDKIQQSSEAQVNSLQVFDTSVADLKDFTGSLLKDQSEVSDSLENIQQKTKSLVDTIGAQTTVMKDIFGNDLSARLASISTYLTDLKKGFDHVGESIGTLPEALTVINQTQKEHHQLLGDRFRELQQFNERFGEHLKKHETETITFETHMQGAATTFEMMATKNNNLIHEINRTLTEVNQTFTQRDQQLSSHVGSLEDTLVNHVSKTENMLGQKLDTMIRNVNHSLQEVSDGMNRELREMRNMSEEVNQNHARLMQQLLQELGREIQSLNRQLSAMAQSNNNPIQTIGLNRDE